MQTTYTASPATAQRITDIRNALSDQPQLAKRVTDLIVDSDVHMQEAQTVVNTMAWAIGMSYGPNPPIRGDLSEQISFLTAWIHCVRPDKDVMVDVATCFLQVVQLMKRHKELTDEAHALLRRAGDAE